MIKPNKTLRKVGVQKPKLPTAIKKPKAVGAIKKPKTGRKFVGF